MKADVIVLHPHKHHVLYSVAGVVHAGADTKYVTMFYRNDLLGRLIASVPGKVGAKASGYFHQQIPTAAVHAPAPWKLRKMYAAFRHRDTMFDQDFDAWCAEQIRRKRWQAPVYHVLQDYMPRACDAVKQAGATLVVEQILNASPDARQRVLDSMRLVGCRSEHTGFPTDERDNETILKAADHIILPSQYTLDGVVGRCKHNIARTIPYGVDLHEFSAARQHRAPRDETKIYLVARANNLRKGGHLFFKAMLEAAPELRKLADGKTIQLRILGSISPALQEFYKQCEPQLAQDYELLVGNVAHSAVPGILAQADLFIMPSLSESMSMVALEAAGAGLPLAITPYCGLDGFADGKHGYLIDGSDVNAIVRTLRRAFEQRAQWPACGDAAYALATQYPWSRFEQEICAFYRTTILRKAS